MRCPVKNSLVVIVLVFINLLNTDTSIAAYQIFTNQNAINMQLQAPDYLPMSNCVPENLTDLQVPYNSYSQGTLPLKSEGLIRILIYFIDFSDLSAENTVPPGFSNLKSKIDRYFDSVSRGKLKFAWTETLKYSRMKSRIANYSLGARENYSLGAELIRDAQNMAFKNYHKYDYDYMIISPPENTKINQISTSISLLRVDENYLNSTILAGDFWRNNQPWALLAHEIGHGLGLIDLYDFQNVQSNQGSSFDYYSQFKFMGYFDLMNWPYGEAPELTAWNRWILNFLSPSEVRCLPSTSTVTIISPIESRDTSVKGLFLKLENDSLLVIELRSNLGFDDQLPDYARGLVVYEINLRKEPGSGPLRLVSGLTIKADQIRFSSLKEGEILRFNDYVIENLGFIETNVQVKVYRQTM